MSKNFTDKINNRVEKKDNSIQENKIKDLQDQIKALEGTIKNAGQIPARDIKLIRNVRESMIYQEIESLAENIKEVGQLQPVLLTKDNYLISGHRRFFAIVDINTNKYLEVKYQALDQTLEEIGTETFDKMQLAENEQRRNLDNFHLSDLFYSYLEKGKKQKEIAEIFNRSKSTISELLSIKKIDEVIKEKLKEIQYFGMTKRKFTATNLSLEDRKQSIIGITPLAKIAVTPERHNQIKEFIELFGSKLDKEDLQQLKYTKFVKTKQDPVEKFKLTFDKKLKPFQKNFTDEKSVLILNEVTEKFNEIEKLLKKLESKKTTK